MARNSNLFGNLIGDAIGATASSKVNGEAAEQRDDARNEMTAREAQDLAQHGRDVRVTATGNGDYRLQTRDGTNEVVTLTDDAALALNGHMKFTDRAALEKTIAQQNNPALDTVVERMEAGGKNASKEALEGFATALNAVFKDKDTITIDKYFSHHDVFIPAGTYSKADLLSELGHDLKLREKTLAQYAQATQATTVADATPPSQSPVTPVADIGAPSSLKLLYAVDSHFTPQPSQEPRSRAEGNDPRLHDGSLQLNNRPEPQFAAASTAPISLLATDAVLQPLPQPALNPVHADLAAAPSPDKPTPDILAQAQNQASVAPTIAAPASGVKFAAPVDQTSAIKMGQEITHAEAGSDLAKMVEKTLLGQKDGDGKLSEQEMTSAVQRLQMNGKLTELAAAMKGLQDAGVQTAAPSEQPKGQETPQYNTTLPNFVVVSSEKGGVTV